MVRFLGTSASRPTVERNVTSIAVIRDGETLMFDCGEGTQRQMMRYGTSFALRDIFFSHMHSDHMLGVIGLSSTATSLRTRRSSERATASCPFRSITAEEEQLVTRWWKTYGLADSIRISRESLEFPKGRCGGCYTAEKPSRCPPER